MRVFVKLLAIFFVRLIPTGYASGEQLNGPDKAFGCIFSKILMDFMRRRIILFWVLFFSTANGLRAQLPVIPLPQSVEVTGGRVTLHAGTILHASDSLQQIATFLREGLQELLPPAATPEKTPGPAIWLETGLPGKREAYRLSVTPDRIQITGHDEAGVFYGVQSLLQLAAQSADIPICRISDTPGLEYRGLHLDVGRNMFPLVFLKKYIDLMALYKLNTFHWHITEDQGWRIEIKKYPELQRVAAYRDETIIGHKKDSPHRFDGVRYGGFYTQEEVKELVKYASARYITVIPEIEMPGHASAALAAYPHLGCRGNDYRTATFWGVFDEVFCAGKESTFTFLEDVLDEILPLFPSKYIHIGGDECPKTRWKACPHCQKRIKEHQLKDEHELQSYFIRRIEKYLNSKGREIIGWDEILEGGLSPNATVMSWRGEEGGVESARQKHRVIMTPESHLYFDYYQSLHPEEPVAAAWYTPLEKVYAYEPYPRELEPEFRKYIIGVQGNVWSEYLADPTQVEYMAFPRTLALAEMAWTRAERKNYGDFLERVRQNEELLKKKRVNYFDRYEELQYEWKNNTLSLSSTLPGARIYYTLDGRDPSESDLLYKEPVRMEKSGVVKSRLFREGKPYGKVLEQDFRLHKAAFRKVEFRHFPQPAFNPASPFALVNGLRGNARYNNGEWVGFSGENLEAVIDLEQVQKVSALGINILKYHWQRMWEPVNLVFYVSKDGVKYREVFRTGEFPENGINSIRARIKPVRARYIKVFAENKGIIPAGEYGAGGKAWLLADEIYVD